MRATLLFFVSLGGLIANAGCEVTDRQVIEQSDQFHESLQPAVIRDRSLDSYINQVGERIIEAARECHEEKIGPKAHFDEDTSWMFSRKMQFHLVNSKTLNAFTTGGEHMYVYTGLLQACKNEDELAAVMCHEYAHVYCRHVQQGTQRQYGMLGAALAAAGVGYLAGGKTHGSDYANLFGSGAAFAGQLVGAGYTRKDEEEADKYGLVFHTRAGWDPQRFGDFFQTMIELGYDKGNQMLSDHPSLRSRVELARERASKLGEDARRFQRSPTADGEEFRRLQRRAVEVGRTMPTDKSLQGTQELLRALPRSCLTPAVHEDQIEAQRRLQRDLEDADRRERRSRRE
jgi:predicted Zn-dependent protease